MLNRLYALVAWLIFGLGLLHMLTTFRLGSSSMTARVWFFGSGIAIALVGVLNLLHRAYGPCGIGLRVTCRAANLVLLAFAAVAGSLTGAGIAQQIILLSVIGGAVILSCLPTRHFSLG